MDLNHFIDFFDREQKILFTSFCIITPLSFTFLYEYVESFKSLEMYVQLIFSASLSIVAVTITFTFILLGLSFARTTRNIRLFQVILPSVYVLSTSCLFHDIYSVGLAVFVYFVGSITISITLILASHIGLLPHNKQPRRNKTSNNRK